MARFRDTASGAISRNLTFAKSEYSAIRSMDHRIMVQHLAGAEWNERYLRIFNGYESFIN